jgi:mRNA-degrading endonuclease HigB of HigAB toxin-antitoxin module
LISFIDYETQTVSIVEILTHADYDKDKWKRHC